MRRMAMKRRKKRKSLQRRYDFLNFICSVCIAEFVTELDCISY